MNDLTLLTVTRVEPVVAPFLTLLSHVAAVTSSSLVLVCDGDEAWMRARALDLAPTVTLARVRSLGYIESVLDDAIAATSTPYIFRIDDDESLSLPLVEWLVARHYRAHPHWTFPRATLYPTPTRYITTPPLYPDSQTRLSIRTLSGGRQRIHVPSPHGPGHTCPYPILHHKLLIRPLADRERIARTYESAQPGAGTGHYAQFSVPELALPELTTAPLDELLRSCAT